jgi:hypothetical protein
MGELKQPEIPIERIAEMVANGASAWDIQRAASLGKDQSKAIVSTGKLMLAEFQEVFREKAQVIISEGLDLMREKQKYASYSAIGIGVGILSDKISNANRAAGPASVHLHLHGQDRSKLIGGILGEEGKRVTGLFAAKPGGPAEIAYRGDSPSGVIDVTPAAPPLTYAPPTTQSLTKD